MCVVMEWWEVAMRVKERAVCVVREAAEQSCRRGQATNASKRGSSSAVHARTRFSRMIMTMIQVTTEGAGDGLARTRAAAAVAACRIKM